MHSPAPAPSTSQGFGGIFSPGEPSDADFLTALFEERQDLAEHLPVAALTGFPVDLGNGSDDEVDAAQQCTAAIARLAKLLRSHTSEYALRDVGASRGELEDLAAALEISLSETLAEETLFQGKAYASGSTQVYVRARCGKIQVKAHEKRAQLKSTGGGGESPKSLSPMDVSLSLMISVVVRQSSQDGDLARDVLGTMQGLILHLKGLVDDQGDELI